MHFAVCRIILMKTLGSRVDLLKARHKIYILCLFQISTSVRVKERCVVMASVRTLQEATDVFVIKDSRLLQKKTDVKVRV
jgi:hypothetical protein